MTHTLPRTAFCCLRAPHYAGHDQITLSGVAWRNVATSRNVVRGG